MLDLLLALPFLMALVIATLRASRATCAWLAALAPVGGLMLLAWMTPGVLDGVAVRSSHAWIPRLELGFSLRLDGLAWMFALLVLGIGALIVMYARYYLSPRDSAPRFFASLLLFMGAMLGMVLAGNLLLLVVFWELTSISSFLLIGYWSQRQDARQGARMAFSITSAGGLALLAGVLLIGRVVGSYELDVVLASGDLIRGHALYPWILALVLGGVFTKSAQFPFHFWLPHAMAAPTPVSAYLHSATMVKAGIFLLARLHPVLAGTDLFFYVVSSVGAATLLVGAWHAIFQHDIKGLLAYSTISHLGLIVLLFGLSTPLAVVAALFHTLNHATFKASLFMAAGIVDHEAGTRDMRAVGNLRRCMPWTSALAIIATLAMAGVPLLNGFLSKEMFFGEALDIAGHDTMRAAITIAALAGGALAVAYSLRFVHETFFGKRPSALPKEPHDPVIWMRIPVFVLVALCLAVGIVPGVTIAPVLAAGAQGVLGDDVPAYSLAIWHGINGPLLMSLGGMAAGIALYAGLRRWFDLHAKESTSPGKRIYLRQQEALFGLAERVTTLVGNGGLQRSLLWLVVATIAIAGIPMLAPGAFAGSGAGQPLPLLGWMVTVVIVAGAVGATVLHRQRLLAVIVIGATGLMMALLFVFLSAPDLALTQLLVEMVTVALMLLALHYLPERSEPLPNARWRRWRDGMVAIVAGGGAAALAWAVMTRPADTIAGELLARSLPEGHGRNVVNVILIDFRGFDTLGEITVFGIAALVVHALLRRVRMAPEKVIAGPAVQLPIAADLGQILFPLALTVSIYLFLRGHDAPGGGFIAGLVLAVPMLMQYVIQGADAVNRSFPIDYVRCIGVGLVIALATGIAPWLWSLPFLTSGYVTPDLPLVGAVPLASAIGFDIGVYLVVFGGAMLILSTMGTVSPHATRAAVGDPRPAHRRSAETGDAH